MEADQHRNSNGGSTPTTQVESVTPEELHKESKSSRNPLKCFKNSGVSATDTNSSKSSSKSTSSTNSSNSKAKPPLVVHHFPTAGRPGVL